MNKHNSLTVQSQAYDIARQVIWKEAAAKRMSPKRAEQMLLNIELSMRYNEMMLHDIISGRDAQFICRIRPDGFVMLGHQAQAVYFSMSWAEIHQLARDILDYEDSLIEQRADIVKKNNARIDEIRGLLEKQLITEEQANKYLKDLGLPEKITIAWLREHVITPEESSQYAQSRIEKEWDEKFGVGQRKKEKKVVQDVSD